jgi:tetratricopeptide (TPR) repeat protein
MKNIIMALGIICSVFAAEIEDKEMASINSAVDLLYQEKFEEALHIFSYVQSTYPDHPIGPFFMGYYYNFLASFYETDKFDSKIVLYYDLSEKKADFHLNYNKKDPWLNFYKGASLINRGYLHGKDGSRFSALTKTFDGISYIKNCLKFDDSIGDAMLLLGTYGFYKSSLISWIWDSRDDAVKTVKESFDKSYFSKYLAVSTLGWIYIDYKKYDKAEEMADIALEKYPESHLFLFLKARALFEQNKLEQSENIYLDILEKLNGLEERYSNKDIFNSYYFLTKISHGKNDTKAFTDYKNLALETSLSFREKEIHEERLDELIKLKTR